MSGDPIPKIVHLPDTLDVWAFSDVHGMAKAFAVALQKADLISTEGHWLAPPATALIGVGDYIDRGPDSAGVIRLLKSLAVEASARGDGSCVIAVRGNHEQILSCALSGDRSWWWNWLLNHGQETLASFDIVPPTSLYAEPEEYLSALREKAPTLTRWLAGLPDAVRWRDTLFVHGGLVPGAGYADWKGDGFPHLWVRDEWMAECRSGLGLADDPAYAAYGVRRVVFGHTPQIDLTTFHHAQALCLDTNACGFAFPYPWPSLLSIVHIPPDGSFSTVESVQVDGRRFDMAPKQ